MPPAGGPPHDFIAMHQQGPSPSAAARSAAVAAAASELARRRKLQQNRIILVPFTPLNSFVRVTLVSFDRTARFLGRSAKYLFLVWILSTTPRLDTGASVELCRAASG